MSGQENLQPPPHNVDAEQSVLGGLLLDNDGFDRIGPLAAEHFYIRDHQITFEVIRTTVAGGKRADVLTVFEDMDRKAKLNRPDLLPYLHSLTANTPSAANIARYAEIVLDRAQRRGLLTVAFEIADIAEAGDETAREMIDKASAKLEALVEVRKDSQPTHVGDDIIEHIAGLEERNARSSGAISTGLVDLDKKLSGGMRGGQLIIIAGRPKMGKTALALDIARYVAVEHPAAVLSMEMSRRELQDRNVAAVARVDLDRILQPSTMEDAEWGRIALAADQIASLRLFLDDQGSLTMLDVRMKARQVKRRHGLRLLVVDYLQLMEGKGDNRNEQISTISRGMKGLAKELDCTVILLSQLNRDLEKRPNKRPLPSDLRDSGAIEQDADVAIFVYRDEVYNADSPDKGLAEVDVALNRQGAIGGVMMNWIGPQTRFESSAGRRWSPPSRTSSAGSLRRGSGFQPGDD